MKRTEIDYVVENNLIRVTGIRNVATLTMLEKEFGKTVVQLYRDGYPIYRRGICDKICDKIRIHPGRGGRMRSICVGVVYSKDVFDDLIKLLKEAGERLGEIKVLVEKTRSKQKTIKI